MSGLENWIRATALAAAIAITTALLLGAWHAVADWRDAQRAREGMSCVIV